MPKNTNELTSNIRNVGLIVFMIKILKMFEAPRSLRVPVLAAELGFEPRPADSASAVLPLDDPATVII